MSDATVESPANPAILLHGDPRLRRRCRDVAAGENVGALAAGMQRAMLAAGGVGLAAPQVGDARRLLVCRDPAVRNAAPLVLINPVIEDRGRIVVGFEEGCLSFPGLFLNLWRPRDVCIRYSDLAGERRRLDATGLLARVLQHEIDHLEGILFIDHLPSWRRWLLAWRLRRLRRRAVEAAA